MYAVFTPGVFLQPTCNTVVPRSVQWEQMQELSGLKEPSFKGKPGVPFPGMSWRPPHFAPHPRSCLFNYSDLTVSQAALPSFVRATYGAHAFDSSSGSRLGGTFGLIRQPTACVHGWSLYNRSIPQLVVGQTMFTRLQTVHGQANVLRSAASELLPPANSSVRQAGKAGRRSRAQRERFYPHRAQGVRNHSWVEVVRRQIGGEGEKGYGCWAYPLLPPFASGSGIFVNVGRTLIVDGGPGSWAKKSPGVRTNCQRPPCGGGDNFVATAARHQGYDSVQFLFKTNFKTPRHPELVLTHEACLGLDRSSPLGVCFPPGVPTRTGVAASRPCTCLERHQFWLNCAGSPRYDNVSAS